MCGFAGFINFEQHWCDSEANLSILKKMGKSLESRGPDAQSIYQDDYFSFVFRRLSIVDLSTGDQPIWNEDHSLFVAVNGEIYNHKELRNELKSSPTFKTESDSEIVLHLYEEYGEKAFEMLNGMFSIVLWDKNQAKLTLARDRLGIKPLYYTLTEKGLIFASELKALLLHPDCPREINWDNLSKIGIQDKSRVSSFLKNVNHFGAGSYACYSKTKGFVESTYWSLKESLSKSNDTSPPVETGTLINQYSELLNDSVDKRLMADVPVGIFLSGGIDSSLIAALASRKNKSIHCFTVVDNATYRCGDVSNARMLAQELDIDFHPILFELKNLVDHFNLDELEKMVYLIESPRFDLEWLYKSELHKSAKNLVPELKVILLGQGADEFAGGYSNYMGSRWQNWQEYVEGNLVPANKDSQFEEQKVPLRFRPYIDKLDNDLNAQSPYKTKMLAFTKQLQFFNLWHEDRTSSFYGIESRVPYLDHRIVEFLAEIPPSNFEELFWNKNLVRAIADKELPSFPKSHPKVPFFVTDDRTSIDLIAKEFCRKIYPNFKERYQVGNSFSINFDTLDGLYEASQKKNLSSAQKAWELLEFMCLTIFDRICTNPESYLEKFDHSTDKAFAEIQDSQWSEIEQLLNKNSFASLNTEWSTDTIVNLPDDSQVLNFLTEAEGSTGLILLANGTQISRLDIPDSHDWIVMLLDEMGRHTSNPKDIQYWSQRTNVQLQEVVNTFAQLVNSGFVVRI